MWKCHCRLHLLGFIMSKEQYIKHVGGGGWRGFAGTMKILCIYLSAMKYFWKFLMDHKTFSNVV